MCIRNDSLSDIPEVTTERVPKVPSNLALLKQFEESMLLFCIYRKTFPWNVCVLFFMLCPFEVPWPFPSPTGYTTVIRALTCSQLMHFFCEH